MGGRGGSSGFTGSTAATPQFGNNVLSPQDAQDFKTLSDYMKNTHNITMGKSLQNLEFKTTQHVASTVDDLAKEFPQAVDSIKKIQAHGAPKGSYACASYDGELRLGNYFKSFPDFNRSFKHSVKTGFHPAGSNPVDAVVSHEAGHLLERALIRKVIASGKGQFGGAMWNASTEAKRIVSQACKDVKATPGGKGRKVNDIIREVSGYATRNRSECLAECVSDYYSNRSNAKPLSKAVWNLLKKELG